MSDHGTRHGTAARAQAPAGWRLELDGSGRLDLVDAGGMRHDDVDLRRCFPVSRPRGPVAVISAAGDELAWLESLATAPPALAALIETVLAEREPAEVITAIGAIGDGRPAEWAVTTARGPCRFRVAHTADLLRRPDGSICVIDTIGTRYEIADPAALDTRSRRLLEHHG